jgi:hypothetical protein
LRSRILSLAVGAAAAAVLLSGCVPSFTPQIPLVAGSDVAVAVEDRLEEEVGTRPEVDCGDDDVQLEVTASLTCVLTDPGSGLEYDVVVTFTKVDGNEYEFDFTVADSPNNPPEPTVDPDTPSVTGDDIAALVVQALTPELPAPPVVSCPEPTVDIVVENITYCTYEDEDGIHDVEVTITEYDPVAGTYSISAAVINE